MPKSRDSLIEIVKSSSLLLARIRVSSALNPMLWLSAAVGPASWLAAWMFRDQLAIVVVLTTVGSLPVVAATLSYLILLFRDPDRLQSEEFQLRHRAIQMIYKDGREQEVIDILSAPIRLGIESQREFESGNAKESREEDR